MDGNTITSRVDDTTERDLHRKVVDNALNATTYTSRAVGKGVPFRGKTKEVTITVSEDNQFQWVTGLENLNASAIDNTQTLQFSHTAGTQPVVDIMLESFANVGEHATIDLNSFKWSEAAAVVSQKLSTAAYGTGTGDQPIGLQAIVDDGTNKGSIGGLSRTIYPVLEATYTGSGGTMSLAKLGTLDDNISASGSKEGSPNIKLTTKGIWSNYESLINPTYAANYQTAGYPKISLRGDTKLPSNTGVAGFTSLIHRDVPVIKDDDATTGVWYSLNERTFGWAGRDIVPPSWKGKVEPVNLGDATKGYESTAALVDMPSRFHGFFYRKPVDMPNQLGMVGRFVIIGQFFVKEPRRNGQLHSITGI